MQRNVPVAIVVGCALIALALYFALRRPPPESVSAQPPAAAPTAAKPSAPQIPADADNLAAATAAIEAARATWRAACWDTADPAVRKAGRYIAVVAFDASGKLVGSGVSEERGASDPSIAQCVRVQVNTFTIPAPQRNVTFEIPFALP